MPHRFAGGGQNTLALQQKAGTRRDFAVSLPSRGRVAQREFTGPNWNLQRPRFAKRVEGRPSSGAERGPNLLPRDKNKVFAWGARGDLYTKGCGPGGLCRRNQVPPDDSWAPLLRNRPASHGNGVGPRAAGVLQVFALAAGASARGPDTPTKRDPSFGNRGAQQRPPNGLMPRRGRFSGERGNDFGWVSKGQSGRAAHISR